MSLVDKFSSMFRQSAANETFADPLVAHMVKTVDARIGAVSGYAEKLAPAIEHAMDYYAGVVGAIPGPISVSGRKHESDALLRRLFANPTDIVMALGRSIEVRESLQEVVRAERSHVYALLGMRLRRADGAGNEMPARSDISDTADQFADHTFRSLGVDAQATRQHICDAAMARLLKSFTARAENLRKNGKLLRSEWDQVRQASDAVRAEGGKGSRGTHHSHSDDPFVHAEHHLTPEHQLHSLVDWLRHPEPHLQLGKGTVVEVPEPAPAGTETMGLSRHELPLLTSSDRRQWLVCLGRFSHEEAALALQMESRAHRYIFI